MMLKGDEQGSNSHDHISNAQEDERNDPISRDHGEHGKRMDPGGCNTDDSLAVVGRERRELLVRRRLFEPLFLLRDHLCPVSTVLYTLDDHVITGYSSIYAFSELALLTIYLV